MKTDREATPDGEPIGARAEFPFDRMTVERFRQEFPRARWSDNRRAWFVPGKTAARRIGNWLAKLEAEADAYADAKGRDAFEFDPISSPYLSLGQEGFHIKTPYSRTVVEELRQVPFARWDGDLRIWHVPFRSIEELRQHWDTIEAAALRNEPAAKKDRLDARKGTPEEVETRAKASERRKQRYPVPAGDFPPLEHPVNTALGIVIFFGTIGELVDVETRENFYEMVGDGELIWAKWRRPAVEELVTAWPARTQPNQAERDRGWWLPTLEELRPARREAKARARRRAADGALATDSISNSD